MLVSPRPALIKIVLSLTAVGGFYASVRERQKNFSVQVGTRLPMPFFAFAGAGVGVSLGRGS